ncbi:MAG: lipid IV(A) 3-deoxy-D-manno-octulosonic acid transferase [Cocleimonas sp.]|nr:lipid IV(A) 3-deoxy-D-manno-octulosonic acid transferase [Cocleimonas sp.]
MSISRFIYSTLLYFLLPVVLFRLLIKSHRNKDYRLRLPERLGWTPDKLSGKKLIWLHAVSVGETIAAKPLVSELLLKYPDHSLLITSITPTGSATVKKLFADDVLHCYFPYDVPHLIHRFIARVQPTLLIIIETEIWPNLYATCAQQNIPLLLFNARLSKQSTQHYLRLKSLVRETLACTTLIAVRSKEDKHYFLSLGAPQNKLLLTGNIKFDITINKTLETQGQQLREEWGQDRLVWVAASTHLGEDEIILSMFKQLKKQFPTLLLIIVPRHPERFSTVYQQLLATPFQTQRRTDDVPFQQHTDIILGDSMGEMLLWYAAADIAFIGGSLVKTGGHNPLEATALGLPVISGRHTFNFNDIYPPLCDAHIAWIEPTKKDMQARLTKLLTEKINKDKQHSTKQKNHFKQQCASFMQQHQGVIKKLLFEVKKHLK